MQARRARASVLFAACAAAGFAAATARAVDIDGVQPAAVDQPQINAIVYLPDATDPQVSTVDVIDWDTFTSSTGQVFNVTAYFDTGASSILFSTGTAGSLNIPVGTSLYSDTGVAGSDMFGVSQNIRIAIANYNYSRTDLDLFDATNHPITTPYTLVTNPQNASNYFRLQIGPIPRIGQDPSLAQEGQLLDTLKQLLGTSDLGSPFDEIEQLIAQLNAVDVIGMPAMVGKVVVIDPTRANNLDSFLNNIDTLTEVPDIFSHTYVYAPGTPFKPATVATDPGIPTVSHHIRLSYGDFSRFSVVVPTGGDAPSLAHNPFIGKDPVRLAFPDSGPAQDDIPGIKITLGTFSSEGNWLLDTGASASMISLQQAANLHIHYKEGTFGTADPILVDDSGAAIDQFLLTIGGIGGQVTVAGFYLDSLLLRTLEGSATSDKDPNNIRFLHAPVLVNDISITDPSTGTVITLDGIFGMNFLFPSTPVDQSGLDPLMGLNPVAGSFNWITFDEPNGILGLNLDPSIAGVPEPASLLTLAAGSLGLLRRRRKPPIS